MKKIAIISSILAVLILLFAIFGKNEYQINIAEDAAQKAIGAKLPMLIDKNLVKINIGKVEIDFLSSNKVQLDVAYDASIAGVKGSGAALVTSGIRYNNGEFFLNDFSVGDVAYVVAEKEKYEAIKKATNGLIGKLKAKVVDPDDLEGNQEFESLKTKQIAILKQHILEKINEKIKSTPIYSLNGKDFKQSIASMALKEIIFSEDKVTATLSVSQFLTTALMYLISGIFAIAAVAAFIMLPFMSSLKGGGSVIETVF
jgi:hypothetical protein